MTLSEQLLAGETLQLDYLQVVYLPKGDLVVLDCEMGCCYHALSLQQFKEIYEEQQNEQ